MPLPYVWVSPGNTVDFAPELCPLSPIIRERAIDNFHDLQIVRNNLINPFDLQISAGIRSVFRIYNLGKYNDFQRPA